ncbi:response regulator [Paenibacillus sp. DMB20]|uniref:response regulator n=1 Tax=Paenibacillus sp. DMB20 TaxID=1642570 RepID=UPI0006275B5C|nr:response regulator [Paenibacillus sp. DMB20]KKO52394.1 hypothetical protein XI25_19565 [Paenibacillus sp. DMB20]
MNPESNLKICFIDDIRTVIEGMARQIRWDLHGITVCGTAINGLEGMTLIHDCRPDIILTDIRMPKLDGLELTRRVKELLPQSEVILLTGYSDFEYAQKAIQLGAFDFITKPFSLSGIEEVVLKAKEKIQNERRKENRMAEMERKVMEGLPILRQEFFRYLLHHKADPQETKRRWAYLNPVLDPCHLFVMVIEIDGFRDASSRISVGESELVRFTLQNILEDTITLSAKVFILRDTATRFSAVLNMPSGATAMDLAEDCCSNVRRFTRYTVSIGIGLPTHAHDLSVSYEQAIQALSYHLYTGGDAVMSYADVKFTAAVPPPHLRNKEQELIRALQAGGRDEALEILDQLFHEQSLQQPLPKPEYLISLFYEISFIMLRALQERVPYGDLEDLDIMIRERPIASLASVDDMEHMLKDIAVQGCRLIERRTRSQAANIIQEAVLFVRENLNRELHSADAARHVHLSTSYFAHLFKKVTGRTFNQFVIQERMEQAKRLLLEDRQVQDIAESLGYLERRYFSDVFKKYTGLTPSEFKQAHVGNSLNL